MIIRVVLALFMGVILVSREQPVLGGTQHRLILNRRSCRLPVRVNLKQDTINLILSILTFRGLIPNILYRYSILLGTYLHSLGALLPVLRLFHRHYRTPREMAINRLLRQFHRLQIRFHQWYIIYLMMYHNVTTMTGCQFIELRT